MIYVNVRYLCQTVFKLLICMVCVWNGVSDIFFMSPFLFPNTSSVLDQLWLTGWFTYGTYRSRLKRNGRPTKPTLVLCFSAPWDTHLVDNVACAQCKRMILLTPLSFLMLAHRQFDFGAKHSSTFSSGPFICGCLHSQAVLNTNLVEFSRFTSLRAKELFRIKPASVWICGYNIREALMVCPVTALPVVVIFNVPSIVLRECPGIRASYTSAVLTLHEDLHWKWNVLPMQHVDHDVAQILPSRRQTGTSCDNVESFCDLNWYLSII